MKDLRPIAGIIGGTLVLLVGISLFFAKSSATSNSVDQQSLVQGVSNIRGTEESPITIVEFSDFQCPACRDAYWLVESLFQKYPGRIRLAYRHFPLTAIHQSAISPANAAETAGDQGKFWEYLEILFDQQDVWSQVEDPTDLFLAYAQQVEIPDLDKFKLDVQKQTFKDRVLTDLKLGNNSGVNSTPTFFVNGKKTDTQGLQLAVEKILSTNSKIEN